MHLYKAQDGQIHLYLTPDDCQRLADICFAATTAPGIIIPPSILETLFDLGQAFLALTNENITQRDAQQPASQDPLAQPNKEPSP